jgi:hypothetical protein
MNGRETTRVRIFRKGNGLVQVDPSPAVLRPNQDFTIVNTTDEPVALGYDPDLIKPKAVSGSEILEKHAAAIRATLVVKALAAIPEYGTREFTTGGGPRYTEFEIMLLPSGHRAEGGSKPGAIIDP